MSSPDSPPVLDLPERTLGESGFARVPIRAFSIGLNLHEFRIYAQICHEAAVCPADTPEPMALALACDVSTRAVDDAIRRFIELGMLMIENGGDWTLTESTSWL